MKSIVVFVIIVYSIYLIRPRYREPRVFKSVFDGKTCEAIITLANDNLEKSEVESHENAKVVENIRKSETSWLDPEDRDIVKSVMLKCLSLTGIKKPLHNCEDLQVLKYKSGGFYLPHFDSSGDSDEPNERVMTCIIALNGDYDGGSTNFPNLRQSFKLNKGDVLIFDTLNTWGFESDKALHEGTSVIQGEKWIANLWIHQFPFDK
jgi:prolyl 4-hydroxylase